jgi:hypothetical protein
MLGMLRLLLIMVLMIGVRMGMGIRMGLEVGRKGADTPQLDGEHVERGAFVAERLVAEGGARGAGALLEDIVEPEAVVAVPK